MYRRRIISLIIIAAALLAPVAASASLTDGLVGYWAFDESSGGNANDSSVTNNDGVITGTPTWVAGKIGNALSFDGSTYVTINRPVDYSFTVCAWTKTASTGAGFLHHQLMEILDAEVAGNALDYGFGVTNHGVYAYGNGWVGGGSGNFTSSATTFISDNAWHFACVARGNPNGSTINMKLYSDGVREAETNWNDQALTANPIALIGGAQDGGANFNGLIDEVRTYNRQLTSGEIADLYHLPSPIVPAVTTQAASSVSTSSVTGNGTISETGGTAVTTRGFVYGTTASYTATTTDSGSYSTGAFTGAITGLSCGATYHYTAYATNAIGTSYGSDTTFTNTVCPAPTVTTQSAASVDRGSAVANGTVTSTGGLAVTTRGFVYGTAAGYGATTTDSGSYSTGAFATSLAGLTCATAYHYGAYATNGSGTSYGSDTAFTTDACAGNGMIYSGAASALPGYVAPRAQIKYPDGRVVYLDTAPAASQTAGAVSANQTLIASLMQLVALLQAKLALLKSGLNRAG